MKNKNNLKQELVELKGYLDYNIQQLKFNKSAFCGCTLETIAGLASSPLSQYYDRFSYVSGVAIGAGIVGMTIYGIGALKSSNLVKNHSSELRAKIKKRDSDEVKAYRRQLRNEFANSYAKKRR